MIFICLSRGIGVAIAEGVIAGFFFVFKPPFLTGIGVFPTRFLLAKQFCFF